METSRICRWVCRRLPLLAGDDLSRVERHRVERHLTTCPSCRAELAAAARSVALLQQVGIATRLPTSEAPPSLWPGLAQQIHARPLHRSALLGAFTLRGRGPADWVGGGLALTAALVLIAGALIRGGVSRPPAVVPSVLTRQPAPATPALASPPMVPESAPEAVDPASVLVRASRRPSALPDYQPVAPPRGVDPFLAPLSLQRDFDLDRGILTNPTNLDTQRAY